MSYNTSTDEITVNGTTYDVERETHMQTGAMTLTITHDGESVFDGLEGTLGYDEFAEHSNPRDWCNVGTMFVDYSNYTLGDEDAPDPREHTIECEHCDDGYAYGEGPVDEDGERPLTDESCVHCGGVGEIERDLVEYLRSEHGARVVMPLYVYEHSGITISAGSPIGPRLTRDDARSSGRFMGDDAGWDTSFVGFVFDTPEGVAQCIGEGATDEDIAKALDAEVGVYASYLEGDVTHWNVEDDETDFMEGCGGYVGDSDECERECFEALETAIARRLAEDTERAYWMAREVETV